MNVTITDIAYGGKGVARSEGKVYFVPFVALGEEVAVRVTRQRKNFAEAELEAIISPSPERVKPPCPYYGRCGGCAYQHLQYAEQLRIKARQVEQTLRRLGRLTDLPMRPALPSPREYGYRNRIRVHLAEGRIGFFAHGSHDLIDIERCVIAEDAVNEALADLRRTPLQDGDYTLSSRERSIFFEQTNDDVAAALLRLVEDLVDRDQQLLVDAYCGAGFFAHALAEKFPAVIGVEENPYAIDQAKTRALPHERYIAGDVALHLGDILAAHDPQRTTVVLDPPAAGVSPRVTDLLLGSSPAQIIYVSCDPSTLARDLGALCRSTYRLESVTPIDMFPQTAEIEVLAALRIV